MFLVQSFLMKQFKYLLDGSFFFLILVFRFRMKINLLMYNLFSSCCHSFSFLVLNRFSIWFIMIYIFNLFDLFFFFSFHFWFGIRINILIYPFCLSYRFTNTSYLAFKWIILLSILEIFFSQKIVSFWHSKNLISFFIIRILSFSFLSFLCVVNIFLIFFNKNQQFSILLSHIIYLFV